MHNTATRFGFVTRAFHWLTALLIIATIALGVIAHDASFDTADALARKAWLFSMHKTLGLATFFVALARILWAISQPRPVLLNADKRAESLLAEVVHWALYASLVVVPLMGWITHAASEGFAPIWWPFGQNLPFVPKSPWLAETAGTLHMAWEKILAAAIVLHVVGALKHHFWDRDATLRRMWSGVDAGDGARPHRGWAAPVLAFGIFGIVAAGVLAQARQDMDAAVQTQATGGGAWAVQSGDLSIEIQQFGSAVSGQFATWTADIDFDPTVQDGPAGTIRVDVSIASLSLGSVTDQAMGPDYFDAGQYPSAIFEGVITAQPSTPGTYAVPGKLTLKGVTQDLTLRADIAVDQQTATAKGQTTILRLPFGIGENQPDAGTLGLEVVVTFDLVAQKS